MWKVYIFFPVSWHVLVIIPSKTKYQGHKKCVCVCVLVCMCVCVCVPAYVCAYMYVCCVLSNLKMMILVRTLEMQMQSVVGQKLDCWAVNYFYWNSWPNVKFSCYKVLCHIIIVGSVPEPGGGIKDFPPSPLTLYAWLIFCLILKIFLTSSIEFSLLLSITILPFIRHASWTPAPSLNWFSSAL